MFRDMLTTFEFDC